MTIRLRCQFMTGILSIALASSVVVGQPAFAQNVKIPPVPSNLQVPTGNTAFLEGHAAGTQNYICLPSASGFSWTFFSPQATLFTDIKWIHGDIQQQIITHFLSPNPDEEGLGRATWQSSLDTSAVWAKVSQPSTDPGFVAAGAIPWLLLQVVGARSGPAGGAGLARTTFVQRLNTAGGVAPSTGCDISTDVGSTALVPYTADYFFYKQNRH